MDEPDLSEVVPTSESWATQEFATLDLGDPRRTRRAIDLADQLAQQPGASLAQACSDSAQLEACYRFFANDCVDPAALMAAHAEATAERVQAVPVVLAINDTTMLDYSNRPQTLGLGPLARASQRGLLAHGTLAVTPDGLPLGVLALTLWERDHATYARLLEHHQRGITAKETAVWLTSLQAAIQLQQRCPQTLVVSVGDREADLYDLFCAPRPAGVAVLVRARHDRVVSEGGRLRAQLARQPVLTTRLLPLRARPGQPARTAQVAVRLAALTLEPPVRRAVERLPRVPVWVVAVEEETPPQGVPPLSWLLVTTLPTRTAAEAVERVAWYRCRWTIERWHMVLKSGCAIEQRQARQAARLERLVALYAVIAWRLLYATHLARVAPALPATVVFSADEWQALSCLGLGVPEPPPHPPPLHTAVRWLADLGGFRGRPGDGEPGATVLWRGWAELAVATRLYRTLRPSAPEPL